MIWFIRHRTVRHPWWIMLTMVLAPSFAKRGLDGLEPDLVKELLSEDRCIWRDSLEGPSKAALRRLSLVSVPYVYSSTDSPGLITSRSNSIKARMLRMSASRSSDQTTIPSQYSIGAAAMTCGKPQLH
jgi:hypothetical protein